MWPASPGSTWPVPTAPRRSQRCRFRAAPSRCWPRTPSIPQEVERRIAARRDKLGKEIERLEAKLANERFVEEGAGRGGRGRARQARGLPARAHEPRLRGAAVMTAREAEDYLLGLELFGMRFGLDRMHKLMTALGMPQRRFASIHVVGSNGKSSTVRFIAAILERHGLRTWHLHLAAPALVQRADRGGGAGGGARALRRGSGARRGGRAHRRAHARPRRRCDSVRGAHRRRLPRAGGARGRGGGGRGRPRRPLRRHQRDSVAGPGAHRRRAGAHALAGSDDHGHRRREACGGARPLRPSWWATWTPRPAPWPSASPRSAARGWSPRRRKRRGFGCARRAHSSGRTSPWRWRPPRPFSVARPSGARSSVPPPKPACRGASTWWRNGR